MIRIITKLFTATVIFTAVLHVAPLFAVPVTWISSTGSDGNPHPCTAAQPCATLDGALGGLDNGGQINCLNSPGFNEFVGLTGISATIDCAGVWDNSAPATLTLSGDQTVRIRNLTFSGLPGGISAIKVRGSGTTLIIENCVFENFSGAALDIEPTGALNLVITNSTIQHNASGILIKPIMGASVTATFNGVTIADNTGGGMKTDTTNGAVSVDISNSTINNNTGNGLNAVSGAGGTNMLNIRNSVIARNGTAGVQANGANAAALIDMTLLDSNASGALTTINGGRLLTYGNNHVVGSAGSGFTGTAPSQ